MEKIKTTNILLIVAIVLIAVVLWCNKDKFKKSESSNNGSLLKTNAEAPATETVEVVTE